MSTDLWHFPFSHFNEKVRWALDHKGWQHRRHALAPGFHLPTALWLSGDTVTPILVVGDQTLTDSTRILAFLEKQQPSPPLYPEDPATRRRALELEEWFDEEAGDPTRRLFYHCFMPHRVACAAMSTVDTSASQQRAYRWLMPIMKPLMHIKMKLSADRVERAERALPTLFDQIARSVGPSGYLAGDRFTVADLTAAAIMAIIVRPVQFPYALPHDVPPKLEELRRRFEKHDGFQWVCDIYARHRPPETSVLED